MALWFAPESFFARVSFFFAGECLMLLVQRPFIYLLTKLTSESNQIINSRIFPYFTPAPRLLRRRLRQTNRIVDCSVWWRRSKWTKIRIPTKSSKIVFSATEESWDPKSSTRRFESEFLIENRNWSCKRDGSLVALLLTKASFEVVVQSTEPILDLPNDVKRFC